MKRRRRKSRAEIKKELISKNPDNFYFEEERIRELRKQNKEDIEEWIKEK